MFQVGDISHVPVYKERWILVLKNLLPMKDEGSFLLNWQMSKLMKASIGKKVASQFLLIARRRELVIASIVLQ